MAKIRGFTLLELSIVLVIIGLIVGGITVGSSMIRAAELRSVITEAQLYRTAILTFRDKYFALPGDMANATDFWGAATNCTATTGVSLLGGTCNGVATDGIIGWNGAAATTREIFYSWHHLAMAGLLDAEVSGLRAAATVNESIVGQNIPEAKLGASAGWCLGVVSIGDVFVVDYSQSLNVGGSGNHCTGDSMYPDEAWSIDKKIDDGMPAKGAVIARLSKWCTDAWTNTTDYGAVYSLSGAYSELPRCSLSFIK